ncbi:PREDICTED: antigen WC1.1-like, partial [Buceros rhinoceros silvestris]|uniref:antigen WC1.1-like n=1 Tax=Buceros rhinoceros silvestris TaxID=175836 RepID=UPI0005292D9F
RGGGGSRCDGRLEIFQHGTWGRVVAEQWDVQEASVACRQLRCGQAERTNKPPKTPSGTGPVGLRGDRGSRRVRLVNGPGRCAGRVEIYSQGSWGTICDDGWDLRDATVVCQQLGCGGAVEAPGSARFGEGSGQIWLDGLDATVVCQQLGCGGAVEAPGSARFGEGSGQIWLDGVNCSGAEAALWDCPAEPWGQHDCGHKEDAGVVCSEFVALRLENSSSCSGRLQVFYNGTWGSVCSNSMNSKSVSLACKELGCGDSGSLDTPRRSASVTDPLLSPGRALRCRGQGRSLPSADREKMRVVGGENGCSGRVELWHRGSWGTVCDDSWDMRDAEGACTQQLGFAPPLSALGEAAFGEGTGPVWLERVHCRGTEASLQDCWAQPGDSGVCRHKEDAAVLCS